MALAAKLDEFGKAGWIMLMIAGFLLFWPIGFGVLGFLICSGRLRAWRSDWQMSRRWMSPRQNDFRYGSFRSAAPASGGSRTETYDQQEQRDCQDYLERLRRLRDRRHRAGP